MKVTAVLFVIFLTALGLTQISSGPVPKDEPKVPVTGKLPGMQVVGLLKVADSVPGLTTEDVNEIIADQCIELVPEGFQPVYSGELLSKEQVNTVINGGMIGGGRVAMIMVVKGVVSSDAGGGRLTGRVKGTEGEYRKESRRVRIDGGQLQFIRTTDGAIMLTVRIPSIEKSSVTEEGWRVEIPEDFRVGGLRIPIGHNHLESEKFSEDRDAHLLAKAALALAAKASIPESFTAAQALNYSSEAIQTGTTDTGGSNQVVEGVAEAESMNSTPNFQFSRKSVSGKGKVIELEFANSETRYFFEKVYIKGRMVKATFITKEGKAVVIAGKVTSYDFGGIKVVLGKAAPLGSRYASIDEYATTVVGG